MHLWSHPGTDPEFVIEGTPTAYIFFVISKKNSMTLKTNFIYRGGGTLDPLISSIEFFVDLNVADLTFLTMLYIKTAKNVVNAKYVIRSASDPSHV